MNHHRTLANHFPQLDVPNFGVTATLGKGDAMHHLKSLSRVTLAHAAFRAYMQPDLVPDDAFYEECTAEVNVISLFFPDIKADRIRICFTAWLAFACMMDDILETLPLLDRETALLESIDIIHGQTHFDDGGELLASVTSHVSHLHTNSPS